MKKFFRRIGLTRAAFRVIWGVGLFCLTFAVGAGGCYDPKVPSGTLHCAAAPAKECPDGFTCVNGLCNTGEGGKSGGGGGGGGGAGSGGGGGTGGATCANAIPPLCAGTMPTPPMCDPVCQRGCPCGQRCALTATGAGCVAAAGTKKLGEVCHPKADDCIPGAVCLPEPCGTGLGRCYRFCREETASTDCGMRIVCGRPVQLPDGTSSGLRACNGGDQVPACDPIAKAGCPDVLACYASGQSTICECPGTANVNENCAFNADCAPGLTCLNTSLGQKCHATCKVNADCPDGVPCMLGSVFGYCP